MPKETKKSLSAGSSPKPATPRKARLREVSGSVALIGALQASIPSPIAKALLSCLAPAFIEISLYVYDAGIKRWLVYLDRQNEKRAKEQREKDQADRLLSAEANLKQALINPHLSEGDKQQLKEAFAQGRKALAQKAILDAFPWDDATAVPTGSLQGSSTG
jgi:hypothetical protein